MNLDRLKSLAVSDSGFIFDPASGHSYTTNAVGMAIIASLKAGEDAATVAGKIRDGYDVGADEAERDIAEFVDSLKKLTLV